MIPLFSPQFTGWYFLHAGTRALRKRSNHHCKGSFGFTPRKLNIQNSDFEPKNHPIESRVQSSEPSIHLHDFGDSKSFLAHRSPNWMVGRLTGLFGFIRAGPFGHFFRGKLAFAVSTSVRENPGDFSVHNSLELGPRCVGLWDAKVDQSRDVWNFSLAILLVTFFGWLSDLLRGLVTSN